MAELRTIAALVLVMAAPLAAADSMPEVLVCHGFGCRFQERVRLQQEELRALSSYLSPPTADPDAERQRLAYAIGAMEVTVGRHTPTHQDAAGNSSDQRGPGQLDCIDESRNTTTYLRLFEALGWLRWHRVVERAYRAPLLLDQHWSAQIEEIASGQRWVLDSWPDENGAPATVQATRDWRWKRPLPQANKIRSAMPSTIR